MFKFNLLWEITAGDEPLPYKCRIKFFVFYTAKQSGRKPQVFFRFFRAF